jgi:Fe-Mn family superoxide dismutase
MKAMAITRRDVLIGAAAGAMAAVPDFVAGSTGIQAQSEFVQVPETLPSKVYTTERVGISRATHDAHLGLWKGYANKTNEIRRLLKETQALESPNQIYSRLRGLKANYAFALGGYINHAVYFDGLGGQGGAPAGDIGRAVSASFGSFEAWLADFKATGLAARGWVFLARDDHTGRLFNFLGDAQDTFPAWNHTLLLAMDVYEHAYYLDFQSARARYIDAYVQCIDWDAVSRRMG